MRDFDKWLAAFRPSIADYKYYVDFDKVFANVEAIKIPLNILNSLIGSKNIEKEFEAILKQYPETLKCIPILLAKRELEIMAMDDEGQFNFNFNRMNYTVADYTKFMRKTGLFDLMENHIVNNLVDYVTGVGTGLDSNGRKNRGGHLMENLVYNELKYRGYSIDVGMVEKNERNKEGKQVKKQLEVDFVCNKNDKKYYIQSAYSIEDLEKYEQEEKSLLNIKDNFKKIIISYDALTTHRNQNGTLILKLFDFLLNPDSLEQ